MGILCFLTILITTAIPALRSDGDPGKKISEAIEKRDPEAPLWIVEFTRETISVVEWDEKANQKRYFSFPTDVKKIADAPGFVAIARFILDVGNRNKSTAAGDITKMEQFLYVVHPSGVKNYILLEKAISNTTLLNNTLKCGIVLLRDGEEFNHEKKK